MPAPAVEDVVSALRLGPATPDALLARLGGDVDRDAMWWAVDEAVRQGLVASTAEIQCGPDGLCGTSVPTVLSLARSRAGLELSRDPARLRGRLLDSS